MMYRARHIDDLLQDPVFLRSDEYRCYKNLVDQGAYPSVKDAILSFSESAAQVRKEDLEAWPDEIAAAVDADIKGRTFPPMDCVASCIGDALEMGTPHIIPETHWRMLMDFLCGSHRGKIGKPRTEFGRQCDADILLKFEQLVDSGISPSKAHEHLSGTEHVDTRTVQRSIGRAREDRELADMMRELSGTDITRFFRTNDTAEPDGT